MAVDVLEDLLEEDDEVVQVSGEVKAQLFSPCEKHVGWLSPLFLFCIF